MPSTRGSSQSSTGLGAGTSVNSSALSTRNSRSTACADGKMCPCGFLRSTHLAPLPAIVTRYVGFDCPCWNCEISATRPWNAPSASPTCRASAAASSGVRAVWIVADAEEEAAGITSPFLDSASLSTGVERGKHEALARDAGRWRMTDRTHTSGE